MSDQLIEITETDGIKRTIPFSRIDFVRGQGDHDAAVHLVSGEVVAVQESYAEMQALLKEAVK